MKKNGQKLKCWFLCTVAHKLSTDNPQVFPCLKDSVGGAFVRGKVGVDEKGEKGVGDGGVLI